MSEHPRREANRALRRAGYKAGGRVDNREPSAPEAPAIHAAGPETKTGGTVKGKPSAVRPDRRARGGRTGGPKSVTVNVVNAHRPPMPEAPAALPVAGAAAAGPPVVAPPRPMPGQGVGPGPMPAPGPVMPPPGMRRRGGRT